MDPQTTSPEQTTQEVSPMPREAFRELMESVALIQEDRITHSNVSAPREAVFIGNDRDTEETKESPVPEWWKLGKKSQKLQDISLAIFSFQQIARKKLVEKIKTTLEENTERRLRIKTLEKTIKRESEETEKMTNKINDFFVDDEKKYWKITAPILKSIKKKVLKFFVEPDRTIHFVTFPVYIKKESWKKEKCAGLYEVEIDLSNQRVRMLNITKRYKDYDSPMILDTKPCWGNVSSDIQTDFDNLDLESLVGDILNYLQSSYDKEGYVRHPESTDDERMGWEYWFQKARKVKRNYSFKKHRRKQERETSPQNDPVPGSFTSTASWSTINSLGTSLSATTLQDYVEMARPPRRRLRMRNEERLYDFFRRAGFEEEWAYEMVKLLFPEELRLLEAATIIIMDENKGKILLQYDTRRVFNDGNFLREIPFVRRQFSPGAIWQPRTESIRFAGDLSATETENYLLGREYPSLL